VVTFTDLREIGSVGKLMLGYIYTINVTVKTY
jgi:hypothetical protein